MSLIAKRWKCQTAESENCDGSQSRLCSPYCTKPSQSKMDRKH